MATNISMAQLITEIKITPLKASNDNKTVAFARVTLGGLFVLNDIKVIEGSSGLFLGMPSRKGKDQNGEDKYFDIFFPITKEAREELQTAVINAYQGNGGASSGGRSSGGSSSNRSSSSSSSSSRGSNSNAARSNARAAASNDDVPF